MQEFASIIVLAVHSAYVLPGSGGLHAVLGIARPHCDELGTTTALLQADSHVCRHDLHLADRAPVHSHNESPQPAAPAHAADCHCCHWFAQGQTVGLNMEIEFSGEPVPEGHFVFAVTFPTGFHSTVCVLGPPVV